jgi:hypothetical protein
LQFEERAEWIGKMKDSYTIRKAGIQENKNDERERLWGHCLLFDPFDGAKG